ARRDEAQQRGEGSRRRRDLVGEVRPPEGARVLPPLADERLATRVLASHRLDAALAGRAAVVVDAQEGHPARQVRLQEGPDLTVLLVALALPAAVEAEGDTGRGDPESEARRAGTADEDP